MWKRIGFLLALLLLVVTGASAQYSSTTNLALKKPNSGLTSGWDTYINGDFDSLDTFLSGVSTLTSNSTTPSVSSGVSTWIASNSSTTVITNFIGGYSGQIIKILCADSNTSFVTGTNFSLGTPFSCNGTNSISLVLNGTVWTEVSRSYVNTVYNVLHASGSPYSMAGLTGFYWNNTGSTYNWVLDAPVAGKQYCFGNYSGQTGALTITSTTGVYIVYKGVPGTMTTGTLVSGGAAGDFVCMEGVDTTHYMVTGAGYGTWTPN